MKRALALLLLASLAHADDRRGRFERFCSRTNQGRTHRGLQCDDLAFFEAFPASGAGTTGACSTTAPTGAKGETLTFTRGSTATCTKTLTGGGLATTGIANGDLVVLSSNVARQMYDANGVLGLLVEQSRTNALLRSQELNNAAWTTVGSGSVPTVTADFAVAPDGTTTAERVQFAATSGAGFSLVEQSLAAAASPHVGAIYVRGNGTSGTIDIASRGVGTCIADCNYVAGSWTRCLTPSCAIANTVFDVGNYSLSNGGIARGAADVFLWQADRQDGAYMTSPIPTTSATVTRSAEGVPTFPLTWASGSGSGAISANTNYVPVTGESWFQLAPAAGDSDMLGRFVGAASGCRIVAGGDLASGGSWVAGQNRWACSTGRFSGLNGASATAASTTLAGGSSALGIGSTGGFGTAPQGIYSRICFDPNPNRCR
jgi:hypothetical protein